MDLFKHKIPIVSIENEVLNSDIESNITFLQKSEKAIDNLIKINTQSTDNKLLIKNVKILFFYHKYKKYNFIFGFVFQIIKKPFKFLLSKGIVSLFLFDLYKIGYLSHRLTKN
jgi:hypothetical protein